MTARSSSGVWVACYADMSEVATFASELSALRHAVGRNMRVQFIEHGTDIRTAVNG